MYHPSISAPSTHSPSPSSIHHPAIDQPSQPSIIAIHLYPPSISMHASIYSERLACHNRTRTLHAHAHRNRATNPSWGSVPVGEGGVRSRKLNTGRAYRNTLASPQGSAPRATTSNNCETTLSRQHIEETHKTRHSNNTSRRRDAHWHPNVVCGDDLLGNKQNRCRLAPVSLAMMPAWPRASRVEDPKAAGGPKSQVVDGEPDTTQF